MLIIGNLKKRIKKSFTLLEMIVVIVIMGILLNSIGSHYNIKGTALDSTFWYLNNSFGNSFNINNYELNGEYPDFGELIISPSKNLKYYTFYKDATEADGYKKVLWNSSKIIITTVWLNNSKLERGQSIKYKINFLTDNLEERYQTFFIDLDGSETKIDDIYNELCIENLYNKKYCIDKTLFIKKSY